MQGQRRGEPGYLAAADVNHDGVISARDLRLARLNLGAATPIRPLAVTLGLGPSVATTAGGAVYQPTVIVTGQTAPGAPRCALRGSRSNPPTTTADATGHYAVHDQRGGRGECAAGRGDRRLRAAVERRVDVTRIVDTTPPAIVIQSPAAGVTANNNVRFPAG